MESFGASTVESQESVDPKFLAAQAAFNKLAETEEGITQIAHLQAEISALFPFESEAQKQALAYSLYHVIIGSSAPELTPELITAFDTPDGYFAGRVREYTGMSL